MPEADESLTQKADCEYTKKERKMVNYLQVEVVTRDPSDIKIFQDNRLYEKTKDVVEYFAMLGKNNWILSTSHGYVRNNVVYEKYIFIQK